MTRHCYRLRLAIPNDEGVPQDWRERYVVAESIAEALSHLGSASAHVYQVETVGVEVEVAMPASRGGVQ